MAAPAVIGYVAGSASGSGARVITPHGSTLPDDLMIVVFATNDIDVTQPGGWTPLYVNIDTGTLRTAIWYKVRVLGETSYSFTVSGSAGSGYGIVSVRGLTVANLVIGTGQTRAGSGGAFVNTAPSLNTVSNENLVIAFSTERTSSSESGISSVNNGFTELFWKGHDTPISVIETVWAGTKEIAVPGAVGATSITYPNTQALNGYAFQIAIPPGPPFLGVEVALWDGASEEVGYVSTWDGADETPATDILALPVTSYTIADMEADFGSEMVYWAHRGGSLDFSEMTMRAYTNAIWHGTKVLEYSCQLSSDGVFVGMHDDTLNRVTALTGFVNLQTWATLQSTPVDAPVTDGGTISRLEELLDTYGQDFVIVVEDKTYVNTTAMLDILDASMPNPTDHIIVKSIGNGTPAVPIAAHARGYKTWGYFYDGEVTTEMPTKAVNYDYLGLNYDATAPQWATALGYSKPVIAHVIPDMAAATTAIGKGAVGLQVSGVLDVVPQINILP